MVNVDLAPAPDWHVRQVMVVGVVTQDCNTTSSHEACKLSNDG